MAVMAPEVIGAAGKAAGAAAGARAGKGNDLGGYGDDGAPIAFMLAVVLLGLGMMALWLAFHNPAEWDTSSGEFPGLAGRIILWMQGKAGNPSVLGPLNTSQPAAASETGNVLGALEGIGLTVSGIGPIESLATKGPSGVQQYFTDLGKKIVKALGL